MNDKLTVRWLSTLVKATERVAMLLFAQVVLSFFILLWLLSVEYRYQKVKHDFKESMQPPTAERSFRP